MRLLILQMVASIGGVWPQLPSHFSNAIKGVACAQTSILLKNASWSCVCLRKFIVLCSGAKSRGLIVAMSNWQNWDMSEEERAKRLVKMEAKTKSINTATISWSPQEAKTAHGHLMKRPYPHVLCGSKPWSHPQTLSTYTLPSFHTSLHVAGRLKSMCHVYQQ